MRARSSLTLFVVGPYGHAFGDAVANDTLFAGRAADLGVVDRGVRGSFDDGAAGDDFLRGRGRALAFVAVAFGGGGCWGTGERCSDEKSRTCRQADLCSRSCE